MTNLNVSPEEAKRELAKRELARRHFKHFPPYIYEGYQTGWHIELLCDALERVSRGEIRFLLVEEPPRHSKSLHVSQLFPAYVVGVDPDTPVIVASYSGDLATDHGRETRNIIDGDRYKNVFSTRLAPDSAAKGKWNTVVEEDGRLKNRKGAYNAAGVGGSITGKGAKFFIIDDPHKDRKEADSEVVRQSVWDWYRSVARTRLTPDGAIIVTHTRWHEDDLIGRLTTGKETKEQWVDYFEFLKNGLGDAKWVRLTLRAIATDDEAYRKRGEALWPNRYPLAELDDIKATLGPYEWSALYQQHPVDEGNREFKAAWFKKRTYADLEKTTTRKFATIDSALTARESSDYTGVTRNYVNTNNEWHFRTERYRLDGKAIIDLIFKLHEEGFEKIGVEEGAFMHVIDPFLKEEMVIRGIFPNVVPLKHNNTMKEVRIRGLVPRYSLGKIFHLEDACQELEDELLAFPKGSHDDCADSAAYQLQIAQPPTPRLFMPRHTGPLRPRTE